LITPINQDKKNLLINLENDIINENIQLEKEMILIETMESNIITQANIISKTGKKNLSLVNLKSSKENIEDITNVIQQISFKTIKFESSISSSLDDKDIVNITETINYLNKKNPQNLIKYTEMEINNTILNYFGEKNFWSNYSLYNLNEKKEKINYFDYFYLCYSYILIYFSLYNFKFQNIFNIIDVINKNYVDHPKIWTIDKIIYCLISLIDLMIKKGEIGKAKFF